MKFKLILLSLLFSICVYANPDFKALVYYYSMNVRIVLTDMKCDHGPGWKAAAQRQDGVAMPACWIQDPSNEENVKLNWPNGDFSVFEFKKFAPITE